MTELLLEKLEVVEEKMEQEKSTEEKHEWRR